MLALTLLATLPLVQLPQQIVDAEQAVCRVVCDMDGRKAYGSGCLLYGSIRSGPNVGKRYVLTVWHVAKNARRSISVTFDGVTNYPAKVACRRVADDGCLLVVSDVPMSVRGIRIADEEVQVGEDVYSVGFDGPSGVLVTRHGQCTAHVSGVDIHKGARWFQHSAPSTQGMSGGPVFVLRDNEPKVIGPISLTSDVDSTSSRLAVVRDMWGLQPGQSPYRPYTPDTGQRLDSIAQRLDNISEQADNISSQAEHLPGYNIRQPKGMMIETTDGRLVPFDPSEPMRTTVGADGVERNQYGGEVQRAHITIPLKTIPLKQGGT